MTGAPLFRKALIMSVFDEKRAKHFVLPGRPL
jgi:hypothetical protein